MAGDVKKKNNNPFLPPSQKLSNTKADSPVCALLLSAVFAAAEYHYPFFLLLFLTVASHDGFFPDQVQVSLILETLHLSGSATPESVR